MKSISETVLEYLAHHEQATGSEIAQDIGRTPKDVNAALNRMSKARKKAPKRVRIVGWTWDQEGQRLYPRAIFALGDGPDAKKPKLKAKESHRNYSRMVNHMFRKNFVFNLGLTSKASRDTAWSLNATSRKD